MPSDSARMRTAPPTAAANRGSESMVASMRLGSVGTGLRESHVASFPAIWALVEAVHAQVDLFHALADAAVLRAGALILGLVALHAHDGPVGHGVSKRDFP